MFQRMFIFFRCKFFKHMFFRALRNLNHISSYRRLCKRSSCSMHTPANPNIEGKQRFIHRFMPWWYGKDKGDLCCAADGSTTIGAAIGLLGGLMCGFELFYHICEDTDVRTQLFAYIGYPVVHGAFALFSAFVGGCIGRHLPIICCVAVPCALWQMI